MPQDLRQITSYYVKKQEIHINECMTPSFQNNWVINVPDTTQALKMPVKMQDKSLKCVLIQVYIWVRERGCDSLLASGNVVFRVLTYRFHLNPTWEECRKGLKNLQPRISFAT